MNLTQRIGLTLGGLAALIGSYAVMPVVDKNMEAKAQTISGRVISQDDAPLENIIVYSKNEPSIRDTTDANGDYLLNLATSGLEEPPIEPRMVRKRVSGGGCEGPHYIMVPEDEPGKATLGIASIPDTLTFDGTTLTPAPHFWSAKHYHLFTGGNDVVNASLPSYTITIPNGPTMAGPEQVGGITPDGVRDVWDLVGDPDGWQYPTFTGWNTTDFPIQTVKYNLLPAEWTAAKTTMNNWESMTGINFYDIQEIYPPTAQKWMKYVRAPPSVDNIDSDGDGFLDTAIIKINTTSQTIINHEAGYRALTDNDGSFVTSYDPSNFHISANPIQSKDIAYVRVTYLLQDKSVRSPPTNSLELTDYVNQ